MCLCDSALQAFQNAQMFAGRTTAAHHVCYCSWTPALPHIDWFGGLMNMSSVGVCRNVTDEALLQLPKFPVLSSLILRGTLASNDGLKPLGSMEHLEHLDLGSKWEINDAGE